eukprot:s2916_g6.t1
MKDLMKVASEGHWTDGTSAVFALLAHGFESKSARTVPGCAGEAKIFLAWCGDSRALLLHGHKVVALSHDHVPSRKEEYNRVKAAGGKVLDFGGTLKVGRRDKYKEKKTTGSFNDLLWLHTTRSFGDIRLKAPFNIVPCEAEVAVRTLTPEDCRSARDRAILPESCLIVCTFERLQCAGGSQDWAIVLVCSKVTSKLKNQDIAEICKQQFLENKDCVAVSQALTLSARKRGAMGNLTAVALLRQPGVAAAVTVVVVTRWLDFLPGASRLARPFLDASRQVLDILPTPRRPVLHRAMVAALALEALGNLSRFALLLLLFVALGAAVLRHVRSRPSECMELMFLLYEKLDAVWERLHTFQRRHREFWTSRDEAYVQEAWCPSDILWAGQMSQAGMMEAPPRTAFAVLHRLNSIVPLRLPSCPISATQCIGAARVCFSAASSVADALGCAIWTALRILRHLAISAAISCEGSLASAFHCSPPAHSRSQMWEDEALMKEHCAAAAKRRWRSGDAQMPTQEKEAALTGVSGSIPKVRKL